MKIVRRNPFKELEDMTERLNTLFGRTVPSRLSDFNGENVTIPEWNPSVDIAETDSEYEISVELAGVKKEDLKINIDKGILYIEGQRKQEKEEKNKKYHRTERFYGNFTRSFTLPPNVDEENIKAEYKEGVLRVILPKTQEAKPKEIKVDID